MDVRQNWSREELLKEVQRLEFELSRVKKLGRRSVSEEVKESIRSLHSEGKSYREISKTLKVSLGTISKVLNEEED